MPRRRPHNPFASACAEVATLDCPTSAARPIFFGPELSRRSLENEAEAYVKRAITMIDRARALVIADRVGAVGLLSAYRATLGNHFQSYQRFKHGRIFDPVVRHGTPSAQVVARSMKVDCLQLGEAFAGYNTRWLGQRAGEWSAYREDMLEVTAMLKVSLTAELRAMRQLLMISAFYES